MSILADAFSMHMDRVITPNESAALLNIIDQLRAEYAAGTVTLPVTGSDVRILEDSTIGGQHSVNLPVLCDPERERLVSENKELAAQLEYLRRVSATERGLLKAEVEKLQGEVDSLMATVMNLQKVLQNFCSVVGAKHAAQKRVDSRKQAPRVVSAVSLEDAVRDVPQRGQSTDGKPGPAYSRSPSPQRSREPAMAHTRELVMLKTKPLADDEVVSALTAQIDDLKRQSRDSQRKFVAEKAELLLEIAMLKNRENVCEEQHFLERKRFLEKVNKLEAAAENGLCAKRRSGRSQKAQHKTKDVNGHGVKINVIMKKSLDNLKCGSASDMYQLLAEVDSLRSQLGKTKTIGDDDHLALKRRRTESAQHDGSPSSGSLTGATGSVPTKAKEA